MTGQQVQRRPLRKDLEGQIRFERGSCLTFGRPDRAALFAHWSPDRRLSRSTIEFVNQLSSNGYRTLIVSACEDRGELDWAGRVPPDVTIMRKPNLGYDFGSWSAGIVSVPALATADRVLLVNDSLVGPFGDIAPILSRFEVSRSDVFGLTDSWQGGWHLQSFFLGFAGGILADAPLARFWREVHIEQTKDDVIQRYEYGLSRLLRHEAYGTSAAFRADSVVARGQNPMISGWWKLVERGLPFVKREIVLNPDLVPRGELIAAEVEAVFGQRIEEWM